MPDALSDAKAALDHANKAFPPKAPATSPAPKATAVTPAKKAPTTADELAAKKVLVDKAMQALPKMHKGGPVPTDGAYNLKAGEHVLTAQEAGKARTHALMASGMKSLAKAAPVKRGTASMTIEPAPAKPKTFTDKNLDRGFGEGGANNVTTRNATPNGSASPIQKAAPALSKSLSKA